MQAFVMAQRLPKQAGSAARQARASQIKGAADDLDSFLSTYTHTSGGYLDEFSQSIAGRDQAMDFMTRLHEYDPNAYDHLTHVWRQSGDSQYQGAAEVLDFVDKFRQWDISSINNMNLRNKIGFLDFLDSRGMIDSVEVARKGVPKGKVTSGQTQQKVHAPVFARDAQGVTKAIAEIEIEKYAAEYLMSFDEGLTRTAQWQAIVAGPGGGGTWGQEVARAQRQNRSWGGAWFLDGLTSAEKNTITQELFKLERVHLGRKVTSPLGSVEQAGVPVSKNIDDIVDMIANAYIPENVQGIAPAVHTLDKAKVKGQLMAFLEDRRVTIKAYDVYKRSLTADGFNMGMWYNTSDTSHVGSVVDRAGQGFTNAFMANPHAITAMPRSSASGKLRVHGSTVPEQMIAPDGGGFVKTGEGAAPGGVLNAQKFMDDYERAVMEGGIGGPKLSADDPIRQALDAKIEMAIEGEQFFAQRAHGLADEVKRIVKARDEAKTYLDNVVWSKKERAQMNALVKSVDKRIQLMDTAEATLARLGTVDQYGRSIPLENLPDEVRNLRFAVDALEDADARGFAEAMSELEAGADAAKWLRQVGEYGDDTIYFPVNKEYISDRIEVLDEGFQQGFSAFGIKSQGPSEIVESMVAVDRFYAQGGFATFLKHYDKVYNLLKGYMIMKPGFHMRNYFSAVFMNHLDGVKIGSYRRFQNAYWTNEYEKAVAQGLTKRAENMKKAMKLRCCPGGVR